MDTSELDLSQIGKFAPESVKARYRSIVPIFIKANPDLQLKDALAHILGAERRSGASLYSVTLSEKASPLQAERFHRKLLRLKIDLNIASDEERQQLEGIDADFSLASKKLSTLRRMTLKEADSTLMTVLQYSGIKDFDDAIERLTKGPKIEGFERTDLFEFDFTNEDLREMLEASFGLEPILRSRLLEIEKVGGFPVQCDDIAFGNDCAFKYGARWRGGYLVLPDKKAYEEVEMQLEGVSKVEDLEHSFKLRASTDISRGFATVEVLEFAVEQPSHFDYLHDLPLSDQDKMRAYFLGIIAHETIHAIQAYGIDRAVSDAYRALATEEQSDTLGHTFVSNYVDRHHNVYKSNEYETLGEDFAEAVRIFLTNANYLQQHFPRRYQFIQENLPFIKENAILTFVENNCP